MVLSMWSRKEAQRLALRWRGSLGILGHSLQHLRNFSNWVKVIISGELEDLQERTIVLVIYSWLVQEQDKIILIHSK